MRFKDVKNQAINIDGHMFRANKDDALRLFFRKYSKTPGAGIVQLAAIELYDKATGTHTYFYSYRIGQPKEVTKIKFGRDIRWTDPCINYPYSAAGTVDLDKLCKLGADNYVSYVEDLEKKFEFCQTFRQVAAWSPSAQAFAYIAHFDQVGIDKDDDENIKIAKTKQWLEEHTL